MEDIFVLNSADLIGDDGPPIHDPDGSYNKYTMAICQEEAIKTAKGKGLEVYAPDAYTLTLDFDTVGDYVGFFERLDFLKKFFPVVGKDETVSKSGNKHVIVHLGAPMNVYERIAAQAILGSDWRREMFALGRTEKVPDDEPILVFEKPESKAGSIQGLKKVA